MPATAVDLEALLPRFRLSAFRPGQRGVIETVLAGQDCLCVMPTGGGKSLCYQLPALAGEGLTLVVSPLIALMKDQVDSLQDLGIRATFVNSTLPLQEQVVRLDAMAAGEYDLVYVVPERFRSSRFVDAVRQVKLALLAVDEAHCISEWGHDFRPDYARLGQFREKLGNPPTIALTATATAAVRKDIVTLLNLRDPATTVTGFARPNLYYEVLTPGSNRAKDETLVRFLQQTAGNGIIYASSRKRCEEVAEMVNACTNRSALAYHAGMLGDDRAKAQDAFMSGEAEIVVATTAFGMGIDKADVRFVVHYNLPGSLEGYYQEAGRAGRDGLPAKCLLLYSQGDRAIHEFFIESAYPAPDAVKDVYEYLLELKTDPIELTQEDVKESLGLSISSDGIRTCELLLEKAGVIERLETRQNMAVVRLSSDLPTLVELLSPQAKSQRRVLRALENIVGPRRHELVYFSLYELAQQTELESDSISRALKELQQLDCVEYVPPFRGRAIHILRRNLPFESLEINFETLADRKDAEYERLNRVVNFAKTRSCRELEILHYFGDQTAKPCGRCDNCRKSGNTPSRPAESLASPSKVAPDSSPALMETARKALAGVARCQDIFGEGRGLGKTSVAKMLCGSKAAEMTKWRVDRLSTYGLLSQLRQDEVVELLDALIGANYIEQVEIDRFRPVLRLTESGSELMKGKADLTRGLRMRKDLLAKIAGPHRPVRAAERDTSPFRVAEPPSREPVAEVSVAEVSVAPIPSVSSTPADKPAYYWTWRLLNEGYSAAECAVIRRLDPAEVLEQAQQAFSAGLPCEVAWFVSPAAVDRLDALLVADETVSNRAFLARLPNEVPPDQAQWFLRFRATS